jgi:hypothetical protein
LDFADAAYRRDVTPFHMMAFEPRHCGSPAARGHEYAQKLIIPPQFGSLLETGRLRRIPLMPHVRARAHGRRIDASSLHDQKGQKDGAPGQATVAHPNSIHELSASAIGALAAVLGTVNVGRLPGIPANAAAANIVAVRSTMLGQGLRSRNRDEQEG